MYDEEGSRLCAAINQTPEYYIWRAERQLLEAHASAMLASMSTEKLTKFNIIDLGAGDGSKTKVILETALKEGYNFEYIPIDISYDSNQTLLANLSDIVPSMATTVITSTFEDGVKWVREHKK